MTDSIIRASGLCKAFPGGSGRVLDQLGIQVQAGEAIAIVGPSGSGKSTFLHMLNGLCRPDHGALSLFGQPATGLPERHWSAWRRTRIATVFQDSNLIPTLSLARNVAFRAGLAKQDNSAEQLRIMAALDITDVAGRYPDQVSGGQRQRGAIAAAFAMQPRLLLADEPTGNLDEHTAERVTELLFSGVRQRALTTIIVTHNMTLARLCDRVLVLSAGVLSAAAPEPDNVNARR